MTDNAATTNTALQSTSEDDDYIKTTTHNFISRQALIEGPRQVEVKGRSVLQSGVQVRGDLGMVRIGRYVWLEAGVVLEPATLHGNQQRVPMMIGNHTRIGHTSTIRAAAIGSMVWIGSNVSIGERCILKDCCVIEDGVVLGNDTVVPPFTRISNQTNTGSSNNKDGPLPMLKHEELPPSMSVEIQDQLMDFYHAFAQGQKQKKQAAQQ